MLFTLTAPPTLLSDYAAWIPPTAMLLFYCEDTQLQNWIIATSPLRSTLCCYVDGSSCYVGSYLGNIYFICHTLLFCIHASYVVINVVHSPDIINITMQSYANISLMNSYYGTISTIIGCYAIMLLYDVSIIYTLLWNKVSWIYYNLPFM